MSTPTSCPLCGSTNQCAVAEGASACWCMSVKIPDPLLRQVPQESFNVACICQSCVQKAAAPQGK